MNVACRTVSGPLSIKGDHSDIMYALNTGWVILFADTPQAVYDMNICGLKLAEKVNLPVIVAFDGFLRVIRSGGVKSLNLMKMSANLLASGSRKWICSIWSIP